MKFMLFVAQEIATVEVIFVDERLKKFADGTKEITLAQDF